MQRIITNFLFFCFFLFLKFSFSQIYPNDVSPQDQFGFSVALYQNYLVVGAPYQTVTGNLRQGATYVYSYNGSSWNEMQKLIASDGTSGDTFGYAVSIYNEFILVGAPTLFGLTTGSTYFFSLVGNTWTQQQKLMTSQTLILGFGYSISLFEDYAIIGAPHGSLNQAVYLFSYSAGSWNQIQSFSSPSQYLGADFGYSVAIFNTTLAIGAPYYGTSSSPSQGLVFLYQLSQSSGIWNQVQMLQGNAGNALGYSLSLNDQFLLIGAPGASNTEGSVYIYNNNGNNWNIQQRIKSPNNTPLFGQAVAVYKQEIVSGSPYDNANQGSAYSYYINSKNFWTEQIDLYSPSGGSQNFGFAVSFYGDSVLIGSPGDSNSRGSIYIFNQTSWNNSSAPTPNIRNSSSGTIFGFFNPIVIAMIAIAFVIFVSIIALAIFFIVLIRKRKKSKTEIHVEDRKRSSHKSQKRNTEEIEKIYILDDYINGSFSNLSVSRTNSATSEAVEDVELFEKLGTGNFGQVYKGKFQTMDVACKKLNNDVGGIENEVSILNGLKHEHIVSFIGIKVIKGESYMIMEFMNSGNLLTYVREKSSELDEQNLVDFAEQISSGMEYLEQNNVIHKDLALRNILCHNDGNKLICKVSDFGLSKIVPENYYYYDQSKCQAPIPIKWSAPEVLFRDKISLKCDVWSFGVLLYELFTKGENPWVGKTNEEVIQELRNGKRMSIPEKFVPPFVLDIINQCWLENSHERPTFNVLHSKFVENLNTKSPHYEFAKV